MDTREESLSLIRMRHELVASARRLNQEHARLRETSLLLREESQQLKLDSKHLRSVRARLAAEIDPEQSPAS
jgi:hypothetical protein